MQRVTRQRPLGEINKILDDIRFGVSNRYRQIQRLLVQGDASVTGTMSAGATSAGSLEARRLDIKDAAGLTHNYFDEQGWMPPRYRDEYASGPYEYGQGGAAPPVTNVNLVGEEDEDGNSTLQMRLRTFKRTSATRVVYSAFELNHDITFEQSNNGTYPIEMHVHYIPLEASTGEQTVKWTVDYAVMNANTVNVSGGDNLIQLQQSAIDTFDSDMQYKQRIVAFNNAVLPVPVGGWKIGTMIPFAVRLSADSTYAGDIGFLKAALHVPSDGLGSRQRFIK